LSPARDAPPVLLIIGVKKSGKTTLMVELIRRYEARGRPVVALKKAGHVLAPDEPGTDSHRFAEAGASVVGLTWENGAYVTYRVKSRSPSRVGENLLFDHPLGVEDLVSQAMALLPPGADPLVLAEGFRDTPYPRIHVIPGPGRPGRPAGGPVLASWAAADRTGPPSAGLEALADVIDRAVPALRRWSAEISAVPGGAGKPGTARTAAAVLVGGRGRRLGGTDKWSLCVGGVPQSRRVLDVLEPLFGRILLVGRTDADRAPAVPVPDELPGAGPLGGVFSALRAAAGGSVFVFAGDMPFLSGAFIRHMLFEAERHAGEFDLLLPRWNGYVEPLHAVYGPGCLSLLEALLAREGSLAGLRVVEGVRGARVVHIPEGDVRLFGDPGVLFLNLNTPADLERAERLAAASSEAGEVHPPGEPRRNRDPAPQLRTDDSGCGPARRGGCGGPPETGRCGRSR
jgi:molybdopterin-guanine dinucleotide biosynthesis protein MobB